MIPNHILNDLLPNERVAILTRSSELHFLVHQDSDSRAEIHEFAALDGYEVLRTHMLNKIEIRRFVQGRERDVGGEG